MKQNKRPIINLFDYANRAQNKPKSIKQVSEPSKQSNESKWSYGLDTLLHFNDSVNLSSIKTSKQKTINETNPISPYEYLLAQAKDDVQKLKKRRIESELLWRKISPSRIEDDKQNQSFAQSEVTSYDLTQSYPVINKQERKQPIDSFKQEIRRQIMKSNAAKLVEKVRKIFVLKLLHQITIFNQIAKTKAQRNKCLVEKVFTGWKQVIDEGERRKNIRKAIAARIKQKRNKKEQDQYLQRIIHSQLIFY